MRRREAKWKRKGPHHPVHVHTTPTPGFGEGEKDPNSKINTRSRCDLLCATGRTRTIKKPNIHAVSPPFIRNQNKGGGQMALWRRRRIGIQAVITKFSLFLGAPSASVPVRCVARLPARPVAPPRFRADSLARPTCHPWLWLLPVRCLLHAHCLKCFKCTHVALLNLTCRKSPNKHADLRGPRIVLQALLPVLRRLPGQWLRLPPDAHGLLLWVLLHYVLLGASAA